MLTKPSSDCLAETQHNTSIATRRVITECYGFIIVFDNSTITIKTRQIAL